MNLPNDNKYIGVFDTILGGIQSDITDLFNKGRISDKFLADWGKLIKKKFDKWAKLQSKSTFGSAPKKRLDPANGGLHYDIPFAMSFDKHSGKLFIYGNPPVYNSNGVICKKVRKRKLSAFRFVKAEYSTFQNNKRVFGGAFGLAIKQQQTNVFVAPQGVNVEAGEKVFFSETTHGSYTKPAHKGVFYNLSGQRHHGFPWAFTRDRKLLMWDESLSDLLFNGEATYTRIIQESFYETIDKMNATENRGQRSLF